MHTRRLAVVLVLAAASACGSDDDGGAIPIPSTTTTTTAETTTTSAAGATTTTGRPGSTTPVSVPAGSRPLSHLVAVRAAKQPDGADRIVFEFREGVPGYAVEYVDKPVHADGSGDVVPLKGSFALEVRFTPARGFDIDKGAATYTGPNRLPGPGGPVVELARTGDFEAVLTWVAGTTSRARFTVHELSAPPRLVVDVSG